jgi:hypothetical protein
VGASDSDNVAAALGQTGEQSLLVAPFADAPSLVPRPDNPPGYLLSCKPNRAHLGPDLIAAVSEVRTRISALGAPGMETISAALAVSNDAATQSFASSLSDSELAAAGLRRAAYTVEPGGRGLVNALQGLDPSPNLVVAASAADAWEDNIAAFDGATYGRSRFYPYYLLAEKSSAVYAQTLSDQATASGFPHQYSRFLGLDYHRSQQSQNVYREFSNAFSAETNSVPEPGFEYAYDCTYLAVYAAVAAAERLLQPARDLPPEAILAGLAALQGAGPVLPIRALDIPNVLRSLSSRRGADASVELFGSSGDLDLESLQPTGLPSGTSQRHYYAAAATDTELYCIDAVSKEFCDTGIVFPSAGGAPSGLANSCSCLRGE